MSDKPHILVIDDEAAIRTMLHFALDSAGFSVSEAEDVASGKRQLADKIPQLILLDWMLPSMSGVEFTRQLKKDKIYNNIPIILLTAKAEEDNKIKGLESGVDDYVVKPFSVRELIARIRTVLRRGPLQLPNGKIGVRDLTIDTHAQRVMIGDQAIKLGPLEYRLLVFFVTHRDRVFSRDALLTHVWGPDSYLDERTVDVHIRRLRKRIAVDGHEQLVQTVHGMGYRFSQEHQ